MRRAADAAGRDADSIELTLAAGMVDRVDADRVAALEAQGARRGVIACAQPDLARVRDQMSAFAERVGLSAA